MTTMTETAIAAAGAKARAPALWEDRDEDERLDALDDFLAVTEQFELARHRIGKYFHRWKPGKDGKLILVHGPSGSGKTTVADITLEEIEDGLQGAISVGAAGNEDDEEDEDDDDGEEPFDLGPVGRLPRTAGILAEGPTGKIRPIVKVFVEPRTRSIRLLRDIVRAIGVQPKARATYGDLVEILVVQIERQQVRMIMLDEVHHMVTGQGADVIKMLLVQLRIHVVGIGLSHATAIVEDNEDLVRHVRYKCPMGAFAPDLSDDSQWRGFLASLSDAMPFDVRPGFDDVGLALRLHVASEGLVGRLMALVEVATELAIEDGLKTIDAATLALAFRQINDVGPFETPFDMKECSEKAFEPIRKAIAKRNRVTAGTPRRARPQAPDFQRR